MRQLGARLPEPPRAETPRETRRFEELNAEPALYDTLRERSIGLEAVPRQEGTPWGLLQREFDSEEKERRFPFLTLAVPGIAAVLALGAFLWSGSLRDRLRQQDAAMNALQAQNQKMADTLEEMSVEQKASNALSSSGSQPVYNPPPVRPSAQQKPQTTPKPVVEIPAAQQADQKKVEQKHEPPGSEPVQTQSDSAQPAVKQSAPVAVPSPSTQPQSTSAPSNPRESYPAPAAQEKRNTPPSEPARQAKPVDAGHSPELVAPYPTNYRPLTATNVAAGSSPAPPTSAYHAPFPVAGANHQEPATNTASRTGVPQSATPLPTANHIPSSPPQYNAAGNGAYAGSLAENVQAVEGLQRHSTVPLQEFHVHEGMVTNVTPALGLSVRHPDPGHGTYSLVVSGNSTSYQLRGQVNNPLVFTDNTTHREYELVVLRIADKQVYGYVRAMR